ncbi:MAG: small multi-drug export protein, partial [Eubacteriaceae bacterium]|nr:small multi-drug export protein [Eubacteriaceae bacterium]
MTEAFKKYLWVFFISMLPIVELRGAVPRGVGMGLPFWPTYAVSVVGNMLPVPVILLLVRPVLEWMSRTRPFEKIGSFFLDKG